jgi:hypothetical protein
MLDCPDTDLIPCSIIGSSLRNHRFRYPGALFLSLELSTEVFRSFDNRDENYLAVVWGLTPGQLSEEY